MNQFISANINACIGCKTCEIACVLSHKDELTTLEAAHFNARIKLTFTRDVTIPVMCRQCEDAACVAACPNGALIEQDNSVTMIQDKCIGCKTCVLACPYGAIDIKMRQVPLTINGYPFGVKYKAEIMKCDLCSDNATGPACVHACPTNALSFNKIDNLEEMKERVN
ncbi:hypothetical protein A9G13_09645 [Gilliamella sp. wkB178]|uniref:4Fe-4S dicluster domain-containing protein n=1 Tax=Gilliamella sp. wkB178 TaxID=3120259 RepID=UPI00080EA80C|nr:4Fe-4S dicluster domain-containing protein [Gilliamella apicola]OCG06529.1 hypothetical protein A9G13_09645 [Gilliamella apicola]